MTRMPPARILGYKTNNALLDIKNLQVHFPTPSGTVRAVNKVNLEIAPGEKKALLGESGSGKTILALALMRLLPPGARILGEIHYNGSEILGLSESKMRLIRRKGIGMIFEQPSAYLNPLFPVGWQVAEAVRLSRGCSWKAARLRALRLLDMTRIPDARRRYRQFPHHLSGGMRQRVMLAMALAKDPLLLVADEPTTSLDPTVRQKILGLLNECLQQTGAACLCITHDWNVARKLCTSVQIMYAGHVVEEGSASQVLEHPRHPYVQALKQAMSTETPRAIPGLPPPLSSLPVGCKFHPRCSKKCPICSLEEPLLSNGVRCHIRQ